MVILLLIVVFCMLYLRLDESRTQNTGLLCGTEDNIKVGFKIHLGEGHLGFSEHVENIISSCCLIHKIFHSSLIIIIFFVFVGFPDRVLFISCPRKCVIEQFALLNVVFVQLLQRENFEILKMFIFFFFFIVFLYLSKNCLKNFYYFISIQPNISVFLCRFSIFLFLIKSPPTSSPWEMVNVISSVSFFSLMLCFLFKNKIEINKF